MGAEEYELVVEADAAALKEIREYFAPIFREKWQDAAEMVILAIDECCANVVRHRKAIIDDGKIHVRAEVRPEHLRVRIGNFCTESDVPEIVPRDLEDVRPGGLGTHFVREIMNSVTYEPDETRPRSMSLVLDKDFPVRQG